MTIHHDHVDRQADTALFPLLLDASVDQWGSRFNLSLWLHWLQWDANNHILQDQISKEARHDTANPDFLIPLLHASFVGAAFAFRIV